MNDIILQGISKDDLVDEVAGKILSQISGALHKAPETLQPLMDRKEAAKYLNISLRTLDELTKNGKIKYSKIYSAVRFRVSDLDYYISKSEVNINKFAQRK